MVRGRAAVSGGLLIVDAGWRRGGLREVIADRWVSIPLASEMREGLGCIGSVATAGAAGWSAWGEDGAVREAGANDTLRRARWRGKRLRG